MPKGKKHRFTRKQDRQAKHIAASEEARGVSPERAKEIGYATVNKEKAKETGERIEEGGRRAGAEMRANRAKKFTVKVEPPKKEKKKKAYCLFCALGLHGEEAHAN